ncbi:MAG: ribose 5-phosphate isomerase B [Planctomycetota bacterium]
MSLPTREQIEGVARDVLRELTGASADPRERTVGLGRSLIGQAEVREARARGDKTITVAAGTIVTPLAHDLASDYGIEIRVQAAGKPPRRAAGAAPDGPPPGPAPRAGGAVAIGADHGGFALKERLKPHIAALGLKVIDVGTHSDAACDYPDLAAAVAKRVATGEASWGVLIDGAGIGSCMAANKVPGVLAATCHDVRTAKNSREHNGANVLCLGSGTLDEGAARQVLEAWLQTPFAGGRHGRRVDKIRAIEGSFLRS